MKLFKKREKSQKRAETKVFPTGFTLMIIPDSSDTTKTKSVTYDMMVKFIAGGVAIAIIVVGLIISMMVHNYSLKSRLNDAEETIEELKDVNARLGKTITSLNNQVEEDKEAFNKIEETINAQEKEAILAAEEAALPLGVPIKNASSIIVVDPNAGIVGAQSQGVVFSTTAGAVVVATGQGVVESVTDDIFYIKKIIINHNNGFKTVYRIQNDVTVKEGAVVNRNDMIGVLSEDGLVSYEMTRDGKQIDPRDVMVAE